MRDQTFVPARYDGFAGLEVDKRSISVTFTPPQGFLKSLRMPYRVEQLLTYVRNHFPAQPVAFASEAGPTGYGLYAGLVAHAYPGGIAAPAMLPKAPGPRGKTNRLDSRSLSETLRGGPRKSSHVPSTGYRELRPLTPLRDPLVGERVALKLRSKALVLCEGRAFAPAPAGRQGSLRGKKQWRALPCAVPGRFKLAQVLDSLEVAETPGVKPTTEMRRFGQTAPARSQGLTSVRTVSGSGWSVASQLRARLGDWRELNNVRPLAGFLGVVPPEHSTGERTARGALTPTGAGRRRSQLSQAAWSALRQDGELRECFRAVASTPPRPRAARVALVAGARKLSGRISVVLRQQRPSGVREKVHSAPLTPEETPPQGTTRRQAEAGKP